MIKFSKKNRLDILVILFSAIVICSLMVYGYVSTLGDVHEQTAQLSTGSMFLVFSDGDTLGINKSLDLGDSVIKKFTVENRGTLAASLSLDWNNLINTYLYRSLSYALNRTDASGNLIEPIITTTNMPVSETPITQSIVSELTVPAGETYYYELIITFNFLDTDQTSDIDAIFQTTFKAEQPSKYRYYHTTVILNGGSIGGDSVVNVPLLKQGGTYTIGVPEREGYNFSGWTVKGLESEIVEETGEFTMGVSDTYLIANWTPVITRIYFNLNGGTYPGTTPTTIGYEESIELSTPTKGDLLFAGWSVSDGKLEDDKKTFTQTSLNDVTITANWGSDSFDCDINILNNNTSRGTVSPTKVNVNYGSTSQFTVSPAEGYYLSDITSSTGYSVSDFTTGTSATGAQTVTISNLNSLNNGTITVAFEPLEYPVSIINLTAEYGIVSTSSISVTYKESNTFNAIANTGYQLDSVTCTNGFTTSTEGDVTGTTTIMVSQPIDGSTSTDTTCNVAFIGREYSVTLNANGGTLSTSTSITVRHGSTYGTLGEPTYNGYVFTGWNTESDGSGSTITESTTVTITSDQILYAQWEKDTWKVTDIVKAILNGQTPTKGVAKTNLNDWKSPANTDETANGLYWLQDNYGTSYYYRGSVSNNYVKFGKNSDNQDLFWRIIRVNGDGSLRMIYHGTSVSSPIFNGLAEYAINNICYTSAGCASNDAKYVGYMYGPEDNSMFMLSETMNGKVVKYSASTTEDGHTNPSTSAVEAQTSTVSSYAKYSVEKWYQDNLNTSYGKYLSDEIFCNERVTPPDGTTWLDNQADYANLGYGLNTTPYKAFSRYAGSDLNSKGDTIPLLVCPDNNTVSANNDKFTVSDTINGNGALAYPVGLITVDEMVIAGSGEVGFDHGHRDYLYSISGDGFSMTPAMTVSGDSWMFINSTTSDDHSGNSVAIYSISGTANISPVINIAPQYAAQLTGSGTTSSPYQLPEGV